MTVPVKKFARCVTLGLASLILSLSACRKTPPHLPSAPAETPPQPGAAVPPPTPPPMNTIDDYKALVAQQILDANTAITFSGRLPAMLPAIVVVNLSMDRDGKLVNVAIKRSRDSAASTVALAAVRRAGPDFAKPRHLLPRGRKTLDFSETFLFDDAYRFQLRSLAGPQ